MHRATKYMPIVRLYSTLDDSARGDIIGSEQLSAWSKYQLLLITFS